MLVTCFSTARSVTNIRSAIAWFERPSAMYSRTSRSRGERAPERVIAAMPADELADDGRIERRATLGDPPHRGGELVDVGDAVLEQVADALGALGQKIHRVTRLHVLGEDEHACRLVLLTDLLGRPQTLVCLCRRHTDVDDRNVGLVHRDVAQQILGIAGLRDDVESGLQEQSRDSLAQKHRVVGEHDTNRCRAGTGAQRREVPSEADLLELKDPLRLRHIGQCPEAEVAQVASRRQCRCGRLGGDDLSSVARGRDPEGAMDVDSDVAVLGERRRAGVQPDPDPHGRRPVVATEPSLCVDSRVCGL